MRNCLIAVAAALAATGCSHWSDSYADWDSLKGKDLPIVEIKCESGPDHCHLEVVENPPGTYTPVRYAWMTDGNRGDLQFEIVTPKVVGEERTICALPPDEAVAGQYRGECMLPEPHSGQHNHDFTARLKIRPNGKKSVYFYFGNRESRHNGEGHTGDQ